MQSDAIIVGGGLVGMTLALALDAHGFTVDVIDSADLSTTLAAGFDGRASAIASATGRMFQAIGLWDEIAGDGCPIRAIRVADGLSPLALDFDTADVGDPLGTMFENRRLRQALIARGEAAPGVRVHAPASLRALVRDTGGVTATLDDGTVLRAPLAVAADGRRSALRESAGIRVARWSYDGTAIVTMIEHSRPHENVAHELFYPSGPLALLPMQPGNRSAVVWTVRADAAAATLGLPPRAFLAEVDKRIGGLLGELRLIAPCSSYPLGFHHAERYVADRLALVGDAAHGIHPIAGQGLNLGLRDVAALTQVLVESARIGLDLGDSQVLERYQRWRRLDVMLVSSVTDVLTRLFGLPGRPAATVRRLGLAAVQKLPPLRRRFMAEARGETGELPALLTGALV